jgi:sulfatase modifying factor 1
MVNFLKIIFIVFSVMLFPFCSKQKVVNATKNIKQSQSSTKDAVKMVWIPGGKFTAGATLPGEYPREYPAHVVEVDGFWMDEHEVTNAQFQAFVNATKYITLAEQPVDWEVLKKQLPPNTEKPADSLLAAGSLVFRNSKNPVDLNNPMNWWHWTIGANWKHPEGPESNIVQRMNHPVVHVAYADAVEYCKWAGKRLPTEAEWEYAAQGSLKNKRFSWGDEDPKDHPKLANIWQGAFPYSNLAQDGYEGTSPVKNYAPNGYGLYDVAGNVWEWTSDLFHDQYYQQLAKEGTCKNPKGPGSGYDSRDPYSIRRVVKGGSFLCHASYCENYRPSAREGTTEDTGLNHTGFRCVMEAE